MTVLRTLMLVLLLVACGAGGAGCAGRRVTLKTWQRDVEKYVELHDNDPNVLRDVTVAGNRRGFGAIGGVDPRDSTDARAVLLGHNTIGNRPWFVYLVGIIDEQKVDDIRLAAVSFAQKKPIWRMNKHDTRALHRYRDYNRQLWHSLHTQRSKVPADYLSFPREADRFDLTVTDHQLDATHEGSGAHWRLLLP